MVQGKKCISECTFELAAAAEEDEYDRHTDSKYRSQDRQVTQINFNIRAVRM